jgi:hypothetical protein
MWEKRDEFEWRPILNRWILILTVFFSILSPHLDKASGTDHEGSFYAGASKLKITPAGPTYLAGFNQNRKSLGVHDDLYARCLTLEKDGNRLTIVSLDLIGLLNEDVKEIIQRVKHEVGENVIIASTHTHSGPDTIGLWGPPFLGLLPILSGVDEDYLDFLKEQVSTAILAAASTMKKAEIRLACTRVLGLSKNIRKAGSLDPELSLMGIRERTHVRPIATLVNFACHPEVLSPDNRLITADFPGYLCDTVEKRWGGIALYVNGALGGMVTVDVKVDEKGRELNTFQEAQRIGEALALRAMENLPDAGLCTLRHIRVRKKAVAIPLYNFRFRLANWLGVIDRQLEADQVLTEVVYIDLGDAQLVTVPGEIFPNLGLKLKGHMGGRTRFLLGLANDELGYIMSSKDYYDDLYAYERSMSIGPYAGPLVCNALIDLLSP